MSSSDQPTHIAEPSTGKTDWTHPSKLDQVYALNMMYQRSILSLASTGQNPAELFLLEKERLFLGHGIQMYENELKNGPGNDTYVLVCPDEDDDFVVVDGKAI